mgnify:CR=1 FL=1
MQTFKNNNKKPSWIQEKINPNLRVIAISSILIAISLISLFSMISLKNNTNHIDLSKIEFTSRPISKGIPNSVVFDFELNKIKSDSIYIQQFWDETKTIKLNLNQRLRTLSAIF